MVTDLIDFDAWYAENAEPTITFRLLGQDWDIPGDPPAIAMLRLERLRIMVSDPNIDPNTVVEDVSYESLTRLMIGDDLVDEWLALGIGNKHLRHVTTRLYEIYRSRELGEEPGKDLTEQETDDPEDSPQTT